MKRTRRQSENVECARRRCDKLRADMIKAYGGVCVFCNEDDPMVLVIDHIFDDGHKNRLPDGKRSGGQKLYRELSYQKWPRDRYQLLCANCNLRKEMIRRQKVREELRVTSTKPRKKEK